MSGLFDINARLLEAYDMAASGEYSEEIIKDTIEAIEFEFDDKADNYAAMITSVKGSNDTIESEIERLKARLKSNEAFISRLKENLYNSMKLLKKEKFKTALHSFWIQKNPPSVLVTDEKAIPGEFFIQPPPELSKSTVAEAIKQGRNVPGAVLVQGEGVRMR